MQDELKQDAAKIMSIAVAARREGRPTDSTALINVYSRVYTAMDCANAWDAVAPFLDHWFRDELRTHVVPRLRGFHSKSDDSLDADLLAVVAQEFGALGGMIVVVRCVFGIVEQRAASLSVERCLMNSFYEVVFRPLEEKLRSVPIEERLDKEGAKLARNMFARMAVL